MDFLDLMLRMKARSWPGYVIAVVAPAISTGIRIALGDLLIGYPFITFFLSVVLTALLGTPGAAVLAMILSGLLASRYAIDAGGSFVPQSVSAWVGMGFFLLVSLTVIALVHTLSQTLVKLAAAKGSLADLNQTLEGRVEARTQELEDANTRLVGEMAARTAAEEAARQSQKMEAIGQLTGGIAHDFNNMLAIVIGNLDMTKRRLMAGQTDILRFVDNAIDGAQRGASLTHRLLAFARRQPLAPVVTDVNGVVQGMEQLLRRSLGEDIMLECVPGGGLWRTRVDPGQLENALLNLAVNARDAMPGGGRLTIETMNTALDDAYAAQHEEVVAGQYIVVAVTDTGTGMTQDVMARAFEPFYTTKPTGSGTGLGLSQILGFVKQSGGHVKIYSEPGRGTTIKIYLRREVAAATQPSDARPAEEAALPLGSPGEVVLVVEDEAMVRQTSVSTLRELGYTVRHAASGPEALKLLETLPIALLFTDVVMPGMTGRELAEAARQRHGALRILYTTGYTPNAIVHNGVVDAGVDLITKPFTVDQIARKVRKVLDAG